MAMRPDMNLDVSVPEEVPNVLRTSADAYYQAENELSAAWQDPNAGRVWTRIARILESAAAKIEKLTR